MLDPTLALWLEIHCPSLGGDDPSHIAAPGSAYPRAQSFSEWVWRDEEEMKLPAHSFKFSKACLLWPASAIPFSLFSEVWNGLVAGICSVVSAKSSICINLTLPIQPFSSTFSSAGSEGHEGPIKWYFQGLQMCDPGCRLGVGGLTVLPSQLAGPFFRTRR